MRTRINRQRTWKKMNPYILGMCEWLKFRENHNPYNALSTEHRDYNLGFNDGRDRCPDPDPKSFPKEDFRHVTKW